jgi:predicted nucleic acid-binding protein
LKVLIDTNVLLDVLAERKPFYPDSARVWSLAESGRIDAYVAAISFSNCYHIVHKFSGRIKAEKAIRLLRDAFTPVDLTAQILNQSIDASFSDFEDAIQFHSGVHAHVACIITRDPDHFPKSPLSILSPSEFLGAYSFE